MDHVPRLLELQSGVIARRQLIIAGRRDHEVKRLVRRRDLVPINRGVLVDHTGRPTWLQTAWAAILSASQFDEGGEAVGACLCAESALRFFQGPGLRQPADQPIHVLIDSARTLRPSPGMVVRRSRQFALRCAGGYPPRVSYADAVLDVATSATDRGEALAVLARAVGDRRSTADRLLELSRSRSRVRGRAWVERVLADIDAGTCSVLEHGFLNDVVRAHGLRTPQLQRREVTAIGVVYRDAAYQGLNIEMDGRLHHTAFDNRDADLDRDLVAATMGQRTVRLGWGQVFRRPCRTAAALAMLIEDSPRRCGRPSCGVLAIR